jgi:hypothetical protein
VRVAMSDVIIVPRLLEISEKCPGCRADLRAEEALELREWREEHARGRLPSAAEEPDGGVVVRVDRMRGGDQDDGSGWTGLRCAACRTVIVQGRRIVVTSEAGKLIAERVIRE